MCVLIDSVCDERKKKTAAAIATTTAPSGQREEKKSTFDMIESTKYEEYRSNNIEIGKLCEFLANRK